MIAPLSLHVSDGPADDQRQLAPEEAAHALPVQLLREVQLLGQSEHLRGGGDSNLDFRYLQEEGVFLCISGIFSSTEAIIYFVVPGRLQDPSRLGFLTNPSVFILFFLSNS